MMVKVMVRVVSLGLSVVLLTACSDGAVPFFVDAQGRKCTFEGIRSVEDDHPIYGWKDSSGMVHECKRDSDATALTSESDSQLDDAYPPEDATPGAISPDEAREHLGQRREVCGALSSVGGGGPDPVFLNFGGTYPNQSFTIVLWEETDAPGQLVGETVCASGQIVDYRGTPQIQLDSLTQVQGG